MKKIFLILIIFILLFFLFFYLKKILKNKFYYQKINEKTYKLLKATTPSQWQKGLMFYKNKNELNGADGMIFIFPDKNYRIFWNKNTYLDLDVYWINDNKIVGKDFLPSIDKTKEIYTIFSKEKVNKVVELVASSQ